MKIYAFWRIIIFITRQNDKSMRILAQYKYISTASVAPAFRRAIMWTRQGLWRRWRTPTNSSSSSVRAGLARA